MSTPYKSFGFQVDVFAIAYYNCLFFFVYL